MDTPNFQFASGSDYIVGERGTTAEGVKDIQSAILPIIIAQEDFETDPISGIGGGDLPWLTTTSNPHTGLRCLRSGAITNSQQSLWTFTVPVGAVNLSFWNRVSSESGFDFFEVYVDSVTPVNRVFQLSGTTNVWAQLVIPLTGVTSVIFRYVKDSSVSSGLDAAFIDDLEWILAFQSAIQKYEPLHLDTANNLKVTVMDSSGDPITGIGRALDCATDSISACQEGEWVVEVNGIVEVEGTVSINDPIDVNIINDPIDVSVLGTVNFVPVKRSIRGVYYSVYGPQNYGSGADAATAGDFWLVNTSPSVVAYIRELTFTVVISDLALLTNLPTMRLERMTFTGSPSSGLISTTRSDMNDLVNTATFRSANTGMTITPGTPIRHFAPPSSDVIGGLLSANAAAVVPVEQTLTCDIDSMIAIRQNQGVVLRQNTAGSTPENRQYWVNIVWEER